MHLTLGLSLLLVFLAGANSQLGLFGEPCTTPTGNGGTCVTAPNCLRLGGKVHGFCSLLGAVCCERTLQCNQVSKMKRTTLSSQQLPKQTTPAICSYTIEAVNANVCQLLVEFDRFAMSQPSSSLAGDSQECTDFMRVGKFVLCGNMAGQHLYLPFDRVATFTVSYSSGSVWQVKVTQLECPQRTNNDLFSALMPSQGNNDLALLAPTGCDQYYTAKRGTIRSFNYVERSTGSYLPGLNYVICVKSNWGQQIEYTLRQFAVGSNTDGLNYNEACRSTIKTLGRSQDFLMIPQSSIAGKLEVQALLYCGIAPQNTKITALAPFTMYFSSDVTAMAAEKGFSIEYEVK